MHYEYIWQNHLKRFRKERGRQQDEHIIDKAKKEEEARQAEKGKHPKPSKASKKVHEKADPKNQRRNTVDFSGAEWVVQSLQPSVFEPKHAELNAKVKSKERDLLPDEKEEKKQLEIKLKNSHKNVLRKLIAVWIFQMSFCGFILIDTYQSRLSDATPIGQYTWAEMKKEALTSNYLKLT